MLFIMDLRPHKTYFGLLQIDPYSMYLTNAFHIDQFGIIIGVEELADNGRNKRTIYSEDSSNRRNE